MSSTLRSRTCALLLLLFPAVPVTADPLIEIGRALFFDTNISEPPGQACATCHNPARAFSDPRTNGADGALSMGADGRSLGDRNTPGLTYVGSVPPFGEVDGHYRGGFFLDGRAETLRNQAVEPLLNPLEMALPDEETVVSRVLADPAHRTAMSALFGKAAINVGQTSLDAITTAIAAFERSAEFSTFDSKFDRYLAGTYTMTRDEAIGRELFFSDLINCVQCHVNDSSKVSPTETFTNHRYHNIGVPVNASARKVNGLGKGHVDMGFAGHPTAGSSDRAGQFRVPGLRNVAVTAPYMHNGVFQDLGTAIAFYGKYTLRNQPAGTNPETGSPWGDPEISETVDLSILEEGQPIDAWRVQHLVAFLRTLTDQRYEHLLD